MTVTLMPQSGNPKLYHLRNYASMAFHYTALAGMVAGSYWFSNPWAIGVSLALSTSALVGLKKANEVMKGGLKPFRISPEYAPRLGLIVKELYRASGLNADKNFVYQPVPKSDEEIEADNAVRAQKNEKKFPFTSKDLGKIFDGMNGGTPNAFAFRLDKPVIVITDSLLKIMTDDEQKAILAHEFTHAAGRHSYISLTYKIPLRTSMIANRFTFLFMLFSTGISTAIAAISGAAVASIIYSKNNPAKLKSNDPEYRKNPDLPDAYRLKKRTDKIGTNGVVAALGVFALAQPELLIPWTGLFLFNRASNLFSGYFSRSIEYQADKGVAALGADPMALVSGLRKLDLLQKRSLKKAWGEEDVPKPSFLRKAWKEATATHPTIERRIKRLCNIAREQGMSEEYIERKSKGQVVVSEEHDIPYDVIKSLILK